MTTQTKKLSLREVDHLIHETFFEKLPSYAIKQGFPHYTSSISDAWTIVEKMHNKGFNFELSYDKDHYFSTFWKPEIESISAYAVFNKKGKVRAFSQAKEAALSIVLAALKAHGVEVSVDE